LLLFVEIIGNDFCYANNQMQLTEIVCTNVVHEVGSLHSHPLTKLVLEEIATIFGFMNYNRPKIATTLGFVEEDWQEITTTSSFMNYSHKKLQRL